MLKQAIVLAGGIDPRLTPLSTSDHPKCLLPVANSPVLLYSLMALNHAGIMSVLVVRSGKLGDQAGSWMTLAWREHYLTAMFPCLMLLV